MTKIIEDRTFIAYTSLGRTTPLHVHTVISRAPNGQVHEHITLSTKAPVKLK